MNALLHNYQNPTETVETIEIWFPRWSIKVGHQISVGPYKNIGFFTGFKLESECTETIETSDLLKLLNIETN